MEPCILDEANTEILDLVASLSAAAHTLGARLHPSSGTALADLMRAMNCYYSNLIEGHNTAPRDIERALSNQFEAADERRNLQLEARAHIRVQRKVDWHVQEGELPEAASAEFIRWPHRSFYEGVPDAMPRIEDKFSMVPGEYRTQEVSVGRHRPPSAAVLGPFMAHFGQRYRFAPLGPGSQILAMAAAHHGLILSTPSWTATGGSVAS
jgi:Fic family protein